MGIFKKSCRSSMMNRTRGPSSVEALTESGYQMLEAHGAKNGLQPRYAPEIVLLFTDVVMPGLNSAKLAEEGRPR